MGVVILIYIVFILAFLVYSAAGIYHLWRFGYSGDLTRFVIVFYALVSFAVIGASFAFIIPTLSRIS